MLLDEDARPGFRAGQIWALTEAAGLPNPVVCLLGKSESGSWSVLNVADRDVLRMASDRDLVLTPDESGLSFTAMMETWNRAEIPQSFLSHCMGTVSDTILFTLKKMANLPSDAVYSGSPVGRVGPPIRYPGDPRIEFQKKERLFPQQDQVLELAATTDSPAVMEISREESDEISRKVGGGILTSVFEFISDLLCTPAVQPFPVYQEYSVAAATRPERRVRGIDHRMVSDDHELAIGLVLWDDGGLSVIVSGKDVDFDRAEFFSERETIKWSFKYEGESAAMYDFSSALLRATGKFHIALQVAGGKITVDCRPADGGKECKVPAEPVLVFEGFLTKFRKSGSDLAAVIGMIEKETDPVLHFFMEQMLLNVLNSAADKSIYRSYAGELKRSTTRLATWVETHLG